MSGAGGKEKDKVEKVGSDFHRKILGGSDTNENISLAQFSVLVLFHSVRGGSPIMPSAQILFFFRGCFLFQVEMKDGYVTNYYSDTYPGLIVRLEFRRKLHYHLLQVSSCSIFSTILEIYHVLMSGFFLDAFPAPRDPKSADFSSFHLEFLVFFLSFDIFFHVFLIKLVNFLQKKVQKFLKSADFLGLRLEF